MSKCVKCGKDGIRKDQFFIGSKDTFSFEYLEGAAELDICGECVKPYAAKQLNMQLLKAIGTFAVGMFFLIVALTQGLDNNLWALVIMVSALGTGSMFILSYFGLRKKLSSPDQYVKDMDPETYWKVVANLLNSVIFNWEALNTKRDMADFTNPVFLTEIRSSFKMGTKGKIKILPIEYVKDAERIQVPGYGTDKNLNPDGMKLIKNAINCYREGV